MWPIKPLIQCIPEAGGPGSEADHTPPYSAKVKNEWIYIFTSPYVFMTWCLTEHRDNWTFTIVILLHSITQGTTLTVPVDKLRIDPLTN
jgi:hypothetical protein